MPRIPPSAPQPSAPLFTALLLLTAACNDGGGDSDPEGATGNPATGAPTTGNPASAGSTAATTGADATTTTTGDATSSTTAGGEEGGPVVLDFGANVKQITDGESVIFTATLTDPDGPDDIQSGSLKSADEAITFGAFTDLGNGTYELTLSWAAIDQAIGIEFEGSQTVDVKAVFFDNQGKKGFATASVDLTCGDDDAALACAGHCVQADSDPKHCGSCGNSCDSYCYHGTCEAEWSECLLTDDTPYTSCTEYCEAQDEVCVPGCGNFKETRYWSYSDDICAPDDAWEQSPCGVISATHAAVGCCCTVNALWPPP